jgi:hypothetical protein
MASTRHIIPEHWQASARWYMRGNAHLNYTEAAASTPQLAIAAARARIHERVDANPNWTWSGVQIVGYDVQLRDAIMVDIEGGG